MTLVVAALALLGAVLACGTPGPVPAEVIVPSWYYDSPCRMPAGETLEHWLPHALPIESYEKGVFACGELSAYAEWLAENCGYDAQILVGRYPGKIGRHAWVVIEGRTLDAETGVWDAEQWLPEKTLVTLEDLEEAIEYDTTAWLWWLVYPELKE